MSSCHLLQLSVEIRKILSGNCNPPQARLHALFSRFCCYVQKGNFKNVTWLRDWKDTYHKNKNYTNSTKCERVLHPLLFKKMCFYMVCFAWAFTYHQKELRSKIAWLHKSNCAVVTYTAIFGSEKAPEESDVPGGDDTHDPAPSQAENPSGTEAPDTVKEPVDLSGLKRPVIIGVVVLALGVGGVFAFKKFKARR